jgi:hypothetical protein
MNPRIEIIIRLNRKIPKPDNAIHVVPIIDRTILLSLEKDSLCLIM